MNNALCCPKCEKNIDEGANFCAWCGEDLRGLTPNSTTLSGPWSGVLIDGRYRLKEKLGEGGMGTVYKVEHVRMGKILALKVLRPDVALNKQLKQRFQQEARLVSRLSHANTIQVFDFGELEDGSLYIAMEYLHGRDLAYTLRAHGSLSEERTISIGCQVLASLAEAHEQNIVHRDIKPANVMLIKRKDGEDLVKVLDFGIAKLAEDEQRKHITGVADFLGTPAYMSPEQARGEDLDARSDLYSVAAMLFELLTGRGVFQGPTPLSIITKQMTDPPPSLAEASPGKSFSPALEQVIRKSLHKRREERYASADEMRRALEKVRRDWGYVSGEFTPPLEVVVPSQMAKREDFDRFERRLKVQRTVAPLFLLALLAGLGVGGYEYSKQSQVVTPRSVEQEPNNTPAEANRIALGMPVRGMIGRPLSQTESDVDLFVFDLTEPTALTVDLTGVADMNLVLEVLQFDLSQIGKDRRLRPLLFLDDGASGEGEHVTGLLAQPGPVYLRIQERAYFTEAPRPPRETTQAWYQLTIAKTPPSWGPIEIEPNDTLETATVVQSGRPVVGFTGTAIPYNASMAEQAFSSPDFFVLGGGTESPELVAAVVIGVADGSLLAIDAGAFELWERHVKELPAGSVQPRLPAPYVVANLPQLIPLTRCSRGFGVRIQPADGTVRPGAQYGVAFITDGPEGLGGAIALASTLERQGRILEERHLLELVDQHFSRSSEIPKIRALLALVGKPNESVSR